MAFTPVSNMLNIQFPDPIGVDQAKRRNALAERGMALDENRNALYQRQVEATERAQQIQLSRAEQEQIRKWAISGADILSSVAQDPQQFARVADAIAAHPFAQKLGLTRDQITPESVAAFRAQIGAGVPQAGEQGGGIGKYNPGDYTPQSFARFLQTRNPADLVRHVTPPQPAVVQIGNVPGLVDKATGRVTMLSTEQAEREAARGKAGATATGKSEAERFSGFVDDGLRAADSLPVINRALELLDSVKTGGLNAAKLAATNLLGVTGADEAELSNNLGKAVLSQLRATFGAQFTEREGARLDALEANFGKSTEGNKRILQQVKQLVERAARRGLDAAERTGDEFAANEIRRAMEMRLSPQEQSGPKPGTVENGYRFKGGNPADPNSWEKVSR